jgi:hypothetical protein
MSGAAPAAPPRLSPEAAGAASTGAGMDTAWNIIKLYCTWTHENLADDSPGLRLSDPGLLPAETVCVAKFWEELAYFVVFQYTSTRTATGVLVPATVVGYLRKAMLCMKNRHGSPGSKHEQFFIHASGGDWWTRVVEVAWKKCAEIRVKLGLKVVRAHFPLCFLASHAILLPP